MSRKIMVLDGNSRAGDGKVYQSSREMELTQENEKLESQNKKLVEALRFYANNVASVWDCNGEILLEECSETARAVLKEIKNGN